MKTLVIIRVYPIDDYIAYLCYVSFKAAGVDCDFIFFAERGEYRWINRTKEKIHYRDYCCNFGGRDNVRACIKGLKEINTEGYDFIIFSDADIIIKKDPTKHAFAFGGIKSKDNDWHYSGQMLIFKQHVFDEVVNYFDHEKVYEEFLETGKGIADDTVLSWCATYFTAPYTRKDFTNENCWQHKKLHHLEPLNIEDTMSEWQRKDEHGFIMPWYTFPALDELDKIDLRGKTVFEYGVGASTLWYLSRGAIVYGIDTNKQWYQAVTEKAEELGYRENCRIGYTTDHREYIDEIGLTGVKQYDIVVVDGVERDECCRNVMDKVKRGGILIFDNWEQPSVHMAAGWVKDYLLQFDHIIHKHPTHVDWQTLWINKR